MMWQPIETCPKDEGEGTLLYDTEYPGQVMAGVWSSQRKAWVLLGMESVSFSKEFEPTQWMPLPNPPQLPAKP